MRLACLTKENTTNVMGATHATKRSNMRIPTRLTIVEWWRQRRWRVEVEAAEMEVVEAVD